MTHNGNGNGSAMHHQKGSKEVSHQPNWGKDTIHGIIAPGCESIKGELLQNICTRVELGVPICIYFRDVGIGGKLDLDEKVAKYWPECEQNGEENVRVMKLMDHSIELTGIDPVISLEMLKEEKNLKSLLQNHLAKAKIEWPNAVAAPLLGSFCPKMKDCK
eukprot:10078445-Ditylum_brightwellii.AAC.1